jgi:3-oxoacyl-[acyl-carrier-protein] synthase II
MNRNVVVTGLGIVSPIGNGVEAFEAALFAGAPNVTPVELFDASRYRTRIAQTVCDEARGPGDPAVAFVLQAAEEAVDKAGLDAASLGGCGLALGTTAAGWTASQRLFRSYRDDDDAAFAPLLYQPEELFKEATLYAVAVRLGLHGPSALLSPACAAASSAIASAAQRIRDGDADVMLAGATDALTEVVFAGFHSMRLLAEDACRPFSSGRRGLVLSEGAAILVLESEPHARDRGVSVLARLSGWGLSCDAAHPTTPGIDGVLRAMTAALQDACLSPEDLDQVSAHGTGSASNDAAEARAIATLLGERLPHVPITAIKGTTGHTEGAAGAFGAAAALLSLHRDMLPPLAGYAEPDSTLPSLRLSLNGSEHYEGRSVLVNASGFGGANAALLFEKGSASRPQPEAPARRAVITATTAVTGSSCGYSDELDSPHWPGGRSLPLDRISSLVMSTSERLLGPPCEREVDADAAVVLGTTYGSQARHEHMWTALDTAGPAAVDPNDFALSTFNAPGSAAASAYGYGGANLIFLGPTGGFAAIEEANRLITSGRARRVLAGGYEEVTPYFRRLMTSLGESEVAEAVCLLTLEDEADAEERGADSYAKLLGHASRAPAGEWADAPEFVAAMHDALSKASVEAYDVGAIVLDPHASVREAQLSAVDSLFGGAVTLIDLVPIHGNCLAASTPLALHVSLEATASGGWRRSAVLRSAETFTAERPVLINTAGLMSGCASLVVQLHARV